MIIRIYSASFDVLEAYNDKQLSYYFHSGELHNL
jgi:hypothetical protein